MFRASAQRPRTPRQVFLAAVVLMTVLVGSLAHIHRHHESASGPGHCTACLLQTVVADSVPTIVVPDAPLSPDPPAEKAPAPRPVIADLCTLALAPKTSPPPRV